MGSSVAPEAEVEPVTLSIREDASAAEAGPAATPVRPSQLGRYTVGDELGRGGMAVVYRATDTASGKQLALKCLMMSGEQQRDQALIASFEREFHTLVQLTHPRIIEVYDFGQSGDALYYTMELLEGGDLRERAPLPWREAAAVMYDVSSSLALLHARRLVHRDISPRNVRRTAGGSAKLIDFGALVPMGAGSHVIGTPPFVAPEVLHRSTLDERTDLFSLGTTLYYALTGRFCYPARDFASLQAAWAQRPAPPSTIAADVPPALDALVMAMISVDPATRPRSAFEVMQRLSAIAGLDRETDGVSRAYLAAPVLVGRDALLADLRARIRRASQGRGHSMLLRAAPGAGRTRVLDGCALDAKIAGAIVLRANAARESGETLAVALSLASQLVLALPERARQAAQRHKLEGALFETPAKDDAARPQRSIWKDPRGIDLQALQPELTAWLLDLAEEQPLAVLIDDLHCVDAASLSWLAALALGSARRRLFVLATIPEGSTPDAPEPFAALERACLRIDLPVLSRADIETLARSLFGDVPNLALLSDRLYGVAAGNVRETLELTETLIARGVVRYEGGQWQLPTHLAPEDLPSSALELCKARIAELSPLARRLAETHALASQPSMSRKDYGQCAAGAPAADVDAAISELVAAGLLAGEASAYVLARQEHARAVEGGLSEPERRARHVQLASLYAGDDTRAIERVLHLLAGGSEGEAIDLIVPRLMNATSSVGILALTSMSATKVAAVLDQALAAAERLERRPREVHELRRGVFAISIVTDEARYFRTAPRLLAQIKRDCGLDVYESSSDGEPMARLVNALTQAKARYDAAAERERVLSPEEAVKALAYYVAISIAIGSRAQDHALIASLPPLLEPFVALSPLLHAMWQNAIATRETICDNRAEHARTRWLEVDAKLAAVTSAEMSYVAALRGAIAYGIALIEARLGTRSAEARAQVLDGDPMQRASAMSLRRVARLHRGDVEGAERYRKQAERIALHANQKQMFTSTLVAELVAHALSCDLAGIREAQKAIAAQAARFPGWTSYAFLADGYFELVRGRHEAAVQAFERGLAGARPDPADPSRCTGAWLRLEGACLEALLGLGRFEEARQRGRSTLASCEAGGIDVSSFVVQRPLALAEAKLGEVAAASARLERTIEAMKAIDIEGLELGATYEARTRIAIWSGDREAAEHYGRLTAAEYRYGQSSPLGARYEHLWDEARSAGVAALPELQEMKSTMTTWHQRSMTSDSLRSIVLSQTTRERGERALALLCGAIGVGSGYLFRHAAGRFELVASHGGSGLETAFDELIASRFAAQPSDGESTIVELTGPRIEHEIRDPRGVLYRTTLLTSGASGVHECAGAVLLESAPRALTASEIAALVGALANELTRIER